jgi:hypothetical protein
MAGEKEAWRRELAGGRARFPERPRGARPVSAERLQTPAEPDRNSSDLVPRPCGIYRAAISERRIAATFPNRHGFGCELTQRFPKTASKDVVTVTVIPLPAPLELRCLEISNMFG